MPTTWRAALAGVVVLMPFLALAQNRPNFSGDWVLVSATATGVGGRGGAESSEVPIRSNTASGAAFNCGRECTIVQKGQALTIDRALLASNPNPAPAVTLQLDGRQTSVVDSFNPPGQLLVTARSSRDKVEIKSTKRGRQLTATQILSIDASQLVVVISTGTDSPPVTLRYKRR